MSKKAQNSCDIRIYAARAAIFQLQSNINIFLNTPVNFKLACILQPKVIKLYLFEDIHNVTC